MRDSVRRIKAKARLNGFGGNGNSVNSELESSENKVPSVSLRVNPIPEVEPTKTNVIPVEDELRYYAVPVSEQEDVDWEDELIGPDVKYVAPEGSWGYEVVVRVVTRKDGKISFDQRPGYVSKVLYGEEHLKFSYDSKIVMIERKMEKWNSRLKTLEKTRDAMAKSGLERFVKIDGGRFMGVKDPHVKVVKRE